jgi:hypothetical protein
MLYDTTLCAFQKLGSQSFFWVNYSLTKNVGVAEETISVLVIFGRKLRSEK